MGLPDLSLAPPDSSPRSWRDQVDRWDVHIYGGLALMFAGLLFWSVAAACGIVGGIGVVLGVFGPRLQVPPPPPE